MSVFCCNKLYYTLIENTYLGKLFFSIINIFDSMLLSVLKIKVFIGIFKNLLITYKLLKTYLFILRNLSLYHPEFIPDSLSSYDNKIQVCTVCGTVLQFFSSSLSTSHWTWKTVKLVWKLYNTDFIADSLFSHEYAVPQKPGLYSMWDYFRPCGYRGYVMVDVL